MAFNHENLKVYQRALSFNVKVGAWTGQWDSKHAICDQLPRAAGSMLESIAMGSAAYSAMKVRGLDYAIGSTLECAACLDLALTKRLLDAELVYPEKTELSQILRMLVGLRKSWGSRELTVREDTVEYGGAVEGIDKARDKARDEDGGGKALFNHERLDVYRVAMEAATMFSSSINVSRLSNTVFRRLDELLTSMVLNIAEGNGRFSGSDQTRFLGTSHEAAIKLAARLDICVAQTQLPCGEVAELKALLERVSVMTAAMIANIQR